MILSLQDIVANYFVDHPECIDFYRLPCTLHLPLCLKLKNKSYQIKSVRPHWLCDDIEWKYEIYRSEFKDVVELLKYFNTISVMIFSIESRSDKVSIASVMAQIFIEQKEFIIGNPLLEGLLLRRYDELLTFDPNHRDMWSVVKELLISETITRPK